MKEQNDPQKIQLLCLEIEDGLKTIGKSLTFDEDDNDSFQNTYDWIIERLVTATGEIHDIAESQRINKFRNQLDQ